MSSPYHLISYEWMHTKGILQIPCPVAGVLHVLVDGKHVIPGGHKLAAAAAERCQLEFMTQDVQCLAGEQHCALVQLLDSKGFQVQVSTNGPLSKPYRKGHIMTVNCKDQSRSLLHVGIFIALMHFPLLFFVQTWELFVIVTSDILSLMQARSMLQMQPHRSTGCHSCRGNVLD